MFCEEYSKNNCLLCGTTYKHRITYRGLSDAFSGLKEAQLITHCVNCRALLRKHKAAKHKFDVLENEISFLRYTNVAIAHLENNNIIKYEEQDWKEDNSY